MPMTDIPMCPVCKRDTDSGCYCPGVPLDRVSAPQTPVSPRPYRYTSAMLHEADATPERAFAAWLGARIAGTHQAVTPAAPPRLVCPTCDRALRAHRTAPPGAWWCAICGGYYRVTLRITGVGDAS
jgi:ribosomal protein L37AE/L43A